MNKKIQTSVNKRNTCESREMFYTGRFPMKYLKENPPINEQMIRVMMAQMGRKPSEKQVRQMMAQMNKFQDK